MAISKSQLMKDAWAIRREYGADMADAMRRAWRAHKLMAIGGTRWTQYGKDRIYLNTAELTELLGLRTTRYNTGNICSATLGGERISNSAARRMLDEIGGDAKFWYDLQSGKFVRQAFNPDATIWTQIVDAARAA